LFEACANGDVPTVQTLDGVRDVRDVQAEHLEGFDAVMHLAAISNDPIGDLNADVTYAINHRASVRLAEMAKQAGVSRYIFSSSCSTLRVGGRRRGARRARRLQTPSRPTASPRSSPSGNIRPLADDAFSPVYLRNATAYGLSPRLPRDLVVHNLLAYAHTIGEVRLQSDGRSWRPFAHIEDISRAFLAALEAPRDAVHNEAFNIGRDDDNSRFAIWR
jgi:nucleoside-diphosphate-sugar epimerase